MRGPVATVLSMLVACATPPAAVAVRARAHAHAPAVSPPNVRPTVHCEPPGGGQAIYGRITSTMTGEPLPEAIVAIEGSQTSTVTDMNGCYRLTMLPWVISWPGTFKILIDIPNSDSSIEARRTRTLGNMRFDVVVPRSAFY